jgi:exopolyphosphatase/guanosine-5'-triphosphate,3'-diphosphate pyrophosphatase
MADTTHVQESEAPVAPAPRAGGGLRIAAIDIGTNSIHMVIARSSGSGFDLADREREVVQIGRGSFALGRLRAGAMRRTIEALKRFVDLARRQQVDRILCTATAAVREARNGGSFIKAAREVAGITPRVIPPEEEGRLIYIAVKNALRFDPRPSLIVDIGGGSAQLVVADSEHLIEAFSAPLGALRLTECLLHSDPPSRHDLLRLRRHVRRVAAESLEAVAALKPARVYGSSGSIHALAELAHQEDTGDALAHLNGHVLTRASLEDLLRRLQRMTLDEREKLPGLDPKRAEIILPGAVVLAHILDTLDADGITISDYGVREGLVLDYLTSHTREIRTIGDVEDLRLRSVLELLQKFQPEERHIRHARHVARLALALFDGLRRRHRLDDADRDLLHFGALLHDLGAVVGYDHHNEHSSYIIRNGNLRGLSAAEVEMIAVVAHYHGKARPRKRDQALRSLDKRQGRTVKWLSAMLRIAEGLDRSHYQLVESLRVLRSRGRVSLRLTVRRGAGLELWAARRRTDLLAKLIGAKVRVGLERSTDGASRGRPATTRERHSSGGKNSTASPRTDVLPLKPRPRAAPTAAEASAPDRTRFRSTRPGGRTH